MCGYVNGVDGKSVLGCTSLTSSVSGYTKNIRFPNLNNTHAIRTWRIWSSAISPLQFRHVHLSHTTSPIYTSPPLSSHTTSPLYICPPASLPHIIFTRRTPPRCGSRYHPYNILRISIPTHKEFQVKMTDPPSPKRARLLTENTGGPILLPAHKG